VVIEKLAVRRMPPFHLRRAAEMVRRLASEPLWVGGFALILVGLITQVLALSLASISIVQAVSPVGTVLLLVLSHFILGDKLGRLEYLGIAALVVGLVLLTLSLDTHTDRAGGSISLARLLGVTIPAVLVGFIVFRIADRLPGSASRQRLRAPVYGLATGLLYGTAALGMKSLSTSVQRLGFFHAVPHLLEAAFLYVFILTSVLGFVMFQTALQRTITSVLVPVNSASSTVFFIVVGTALFHERLPASATSLALRLAAFATIAAGLGALIAVGEVEVLEQDPRDRQRRDLRGT
jgi:drug/metabolite transporter (DMT)-like permease